MRKAKGIAVLAALILSFSGCANTENPHTAGNHSQETVSAEIIQSTEPEESSAASVSESKENLEEPTPTAKAETAQAEVLLLNTTESSEAESQVPPTVAENKTPESEPPKTVESTPEPKPTPSISGKKTTPEPAPTEPPQETTPPDEPAVPAFQIQTWIDFAVGYAESVGLNVLPDAMDCWDNPIVAGSHSLYLERDIQSRLNRYSRDGEITDVWVWAEERYDGNYDLYIGYA